MASSAGHTVAGLARHLESRGVAVEVRGDASRVVGRLDALDRADGSTLTFVRSGSFVAALEGSAAAAVVISRGAMPKGDAALTTAATLLVVPDADQAMVHLLELFAPAKAKPAAGVHPSAVVAAGTVIDASASVGPCCVIGAGATIGAGAVLVSHVSLGEGASIGARTVVHPGVCVADRCRVGADCIIHSTVTVGADGFGYVPAPGGKGLMKVPHIGHVEIEDQVEIGAGTCIDRGKFGPTVIGRGTKIDNLVQIAHNCRIGRCCILCGQVGLAGSVTLGDGVVLGARVGIADNVTIGAGAMLGANSATSTDLAGGEKYLGQPAIPIRQALKAYSLWTELPELAKRLRELERLAERVQASP